jgi:hypothetical protein
MICCQRLGNVRRQPERLHAQLLDLVRGLLAVLEFARADHDIRTRLGEPGRHLQPESCRAARHHAHLPLQTE